MTHAGKTYFFFFFNDTAPTEIYTLPLHDALPISRLRHVVHPAERRRLVSGVGSTGPRPHARVPRRPPLLRGHVQDRKSTRLNSSHGYISYAVFCLKKKNKNESGQNNCKLRFSL